MAGRFCSKPCADAASTGRPADPEKQEDRICPGCGQTFRVFTWRQVTHCSKECWRKATHIEATCQHCGRQYTHIASLAGRKYCSMRCYGAAHDKGGSVYYGANWAKQRLLAIARDGYRCRDCGSTEELHVHHLVAVREFSGDWQSANELDNLFTCCPPCHLKRHGGQYH